MKPEEYRTSYIVTVETPYQVESDQIKGTHSSTGALNIGRVVWVKENFKNDGSESYVSAYADGIGIISVDSGNLRRAS